MGWAERINRERKNSERNEPTIKEAQMWQSLGRAIKRFGRAALALLITGAVATATEDPKWLLFAPLIQAVAKYLRERLGLKYLPL